MLYAILPRPRARERATGQNGCIICGTESRTPWDGIHSDETSSSLDVFALTGAPPLVPHTNHSHPLSFSSDLHDSRAARPSSFGGRTIQTILGGASEREVRRRRRIASIFTRGCNKIEQFTGLGIHLMHVVKSCKYSHQVQTFPQCPSSGKKYVIGIDLKRYLLEV